jgi:hypothetical protein
MSAIFKFMYYVLSGSRCPPDFAITRALTVKDRLSQRKPDYNKFNNLDLMQVIVGFYITFYALDLKAFCF